jgi:hypothetical protein
MDGITNALFSHFTVMYVDWLFVPFNYYIVRIIDWRRGLSLYAIMVLSLTLNIVTHAYWQATRVDPGHMISSDHVMLLGGWVHLWFSTLQTTLVCAFLFTQRKLPRYSTRATWLFLAYLVCSGISGYIMNHGFMITDVMMIVLGTLCLIVGPRLTHTRCH